jgi:hypothetical protein
VAARFGLEEVTWSGVGLEGVLAVMMSNGVHRAERLGFIPREQEIPIMPFPVCLELLLEYWGAPFGPAITLD